MNVLIVNTNRFKEPFPVMPIGACMVAEAAEKHGHNVRFIDLMFKKDPIATLKRELEKTEPDVVGLSIRNLDNNSMRAPESLFEVIRPITEYIHENSRAKVVLGGPAVGILPEDLLRYSSADFAIFKNGATVFPELLQVISNGGSTSELQGLAWLEGDSYYAVDGMDTELLKDEECLSPDFSKWIDINKYRSKFSTIPVLSKRGCHFKCVYCTCPKFEGSGYRLRPPDSVVDDIQKLSAKRLNDIEFVDSVFNSPYDHAYAVCEGVARSGLDVRLQSVNMNPLFIDDALLSIMERAGFVGIGITVESASDPVLKGLNKGYTLKQVQKAAEIISKHDMPCLWIFLLGGPGETKETVLETLHFAETCIKPTDAAYFGTGIRIYPRTELERIAREEGVLTHSSNDMLDPVFYFSPALNKSWVEEKLGLILSGNLNFFDAIILNHPLLPKLFNICRWLGVKSPLWKHSRTIRRGLNIMRTRK